MANLISALKSSVFHSKQKGCVIVWYGHPRGKDIIITIVDEINGDTERKYIKKGQCKTHNAKLCGCGFEVGTHEGTISPGYKPASPP